MQLYFILFNFAVIVDVPAFIPFTIPFLSTVAIFLLLELHVGFLVVLLSFSVTVFVTTIVALLRFNSGFFCSSFISGVTISLFYKLDPPTVTSFVND